MSEARYSPAELLRALANPNRLRILCALCDGTRSAGELAELTRLSRSALSQHMARLTREGLVRANRDAKRVIYEIAGPEPAEVLKTLSILYCDSAPDRSSERSLAGVRPEGSTRSTGHTPDSKTDVKTDVKTEGDLR